MKKILVYGMSDNPGGMESYILMAMEQLKAHDIQMDFITDFPTIAYEDKLKEAGANIYYFPAKGKKLLKHWKGIRKVLKTHPEYETVYFNVLDAGAVFTAIVPKLMGRRVVIHSHNGDTDKVKLHKRCKKLLSKITDGFVACSKVAAQYMFTDKVQDEVLIIPNAIDVDRFALSQETRDRVRQELGLEDNFVVCHIGRITRQKNPYRMLDIFEEVYKRDRSARLVYVGDGDITDEVTENVGRRVHEAEKSWEEGTAKEGYASEKFTPHMRMLGVRADIPDIMQAADIFLLPSLYEGLPIVAIEAQAAGLPTLMSTNITEEVGLTNKAEFISLEEDDSVWADRILAHKDIERTSGIEAVRLAGYDKKDMSDVFKRLTDLL